MARSRPGVRVAEGAHGARAVADARFLLRRRRREGPTELVGDEQRVVAEAAGAARRARRSAPAQTPSACSTPSVRPARARRRSGSARRRSAASPQDARAAVRSAPRPTARSAPSVRRERPTSASTSRPESSASAGSPVAVATARAFSDGVVGVRRPVFLGQPDVGKVGERAHVDRSPFADQRAQLRDLARVRRGEHELRRDHDVPWQPHAGGAKRRGAGASVSRAMPARPSATSCAELALA